MATIALAGLDKAEVLAALYNASKPQGMGFLHYDPTPMTVEQARELLQRTTYFWYLKGRVMKVDLSGDTLETRNYDRDNGEGACERVISSLKETLDINSVLIRSQHVSAARQSLEDISEHLYEESVYTQEGGVMRVYLGVGDMAPYLEPKLDEAERSLKSPLE